jgi:hypothetical protein
VDTVNPSLPPLFARLTCAVRALGVSQNDEPSRVSGERYDIALALSDHGSGCKRSECIELLRDAMGVEESNPASPRGLVHLVHHLGENQLLDLAFDNSDDRWVRRQAEPRQDLI